MTEFGRHLERSDQDLTREALDLALADAGAEQRDVEQAFFGSCVVGFMQDQHMIAGHQMIADKIATKATNIDAAHLLTYRAVSMIQKLLISRALTGINAFR